MAKRYRTIGINRHRSYTYQEIHDKFGPTPQTLGRWEREDGLPVMKSRKPYLVHGADLKPLVVKKNGTGGTPLEPGTFRCFTCGARSKPLGDMADYFPDAMPSPRIKALCGACEKPVGMYIGKARLAKYLAILDIAIANPL